MVKKRKYVGILTYLHADYRGIHHDPSLLLFFFPSFPHGPPFPVIPDLVFLFCSSKHCNVCPLHLFNHFLLSPPLFFFLAQVFLFFVL
jgi:hypothetical protein